MSHWRGHKSNSWNLGLRCCFNCWWFMQCGARPLQPNPQKIHSHLKWELGFIQMSKYAMWLPTFSSEKTFFILYYRFYLLFYFICYSIKKKTLWPYLLFSCSISKKNPCYTETTYLLKCRWGKYCSVNPCLPTTPRVTSLAWRYLPVFVCTAGMVVT